MLQRVPVQGAWETSAACLRVLGRCSPSGARATLVVVVCWLVLVAPSALGQIVLNEVLATNRLSNLDDDGDSSDWVELTNLGAQPVNLLDHALSDNVDRPRKWVFPDVELDPGSHLLVWCSGKDRFVPPGDAITQPNSRVPFDPSLVSTGADWRYLTGQPGDVGPPAGWKDPAFDDAAWPTGKAGFGFGDDDDATVLPTGIGAVFLRTRFQIAAGRMPRTLILQIRLDDGCVAYLNGTRVLEVNFPADAEPTFASLATSNAEARNQRRFDLTPHLGLLREGENLLAFALMNRTVAGDDLSLIPELGTVLPVLHSSFKLAGDGETITLTGPDGALLDSVTLPLQSEDQSYGRLPGGTGAFGYLLVPTPGLPNEGPVSPTPLVVGDTKFSVNRGFHETPFALELSTETPGAEIRYTLDGSAPDATSGVVYSGKILIEKTTVVRAAAFKAGFKPTNVDTHTYLFLDDVIRQDANATIAAGFPRSWNGTPPDYGMDPDVIAQDGSDKYGGKYAATIRDDLKAVSTLSIAMKTDDLFGQRGIYSNSESRGIAWERATSVELIDPTGGAEFQVDAGIRVQGGAFRSHGLTKKHSLRLVFKSIYGPSKLKFDLFRDPGATDSFDTITLRANSNDGWQWDAASSKPTYVRDTFGRETVLAMGGVSSHHRFVHVYLNGFYWGLYEAVERPDSSFSATYFGGDKDEWDAVSNDQVAQGSLVSWTTLLNLARQGFTTMAAYQAALGNLPDGTDDPEREAHVDPVNVADYMITNLYVGNTDWPFKNWWTGRRRVQSTGYKYYMWDSEWSLGLQSDLNTNQVNVNTGVAVPYGALRNNPEFRLLFADRLQRHFSPGGALHVDPLSKRWDPARPERNAPAARFAKLAAEVEQALVAESARWGDQHAARPYTRDEHWRNERDSLLRGYFPQRSANVLAQFRTAKLFPSIDPPLYNLPAGPVPAGALLAIRGSAGDTYYTVDGSDPRSLGGALSPTAIPLTPPEVRVLVPDRAEARYLVPTDGSLALDWTATGFNDGAWSRGATGLGFEGATGLETEINTDVGGVMLNSSASIYVRLPFDVENPSALAFLALGIKYDDGYVAYLNGTRVSGENAPDAPEWSSQATKTHADAQASVYEQVDLSRYAGLLVRGRNVLAIHGLNAKPTDNDFLIAAQLEALEPRGEPIRLDRTTMVKARSRLNQEWSAVNEATFVVESAVPLRITEIMYHPAPPPAESPFESEDFEFIELQNVGRAELSLSGIRLTGGVELDLSLVEPASLPPGAIALVVRNRDAFAARYPGALPVVGEFDGKLANEGDQLLLLGPIGETLLEVKYEKAWAPEADGGGRSLVIRNPLASTSTWNSAASWKASERDGGSPGLPEPGTLEGGRQLPADWNQDGRRNVTDAVRLLLRLFAGLDAPLPCDGGDLRTGANLAVHDVSGDGKVDLGDAVHLIQYLFRAGPAPALGAKCTRVAGCPDVCEP